MRKEKNPEKGNLYLYLIIKAIVFLSTDFFLVGFTPTGWDIYPPLSRVSERKRFGIFFLSSRMSTDPTDPHPDIFPFPPGCRRSRSLGSSMPHLLLAHLLAGESLKAREQHRQVALKRSRLPVDGRVEAGKGRRRKGKAGQRRTTHPGTG